MKKLIIMTVIFLSSLSAAQTSTYINQTEDHITIGNKFLEREIYLAPRKIGTVKIINKLSGTTYVTQSDEFELGIVFAGSGPAYGKAQNGENIGVLKINDFDLVDIKKEELPGDVKRLSLNLKFAGYHTTFLVTLFYEVSPAEYIRKWLEISDSSLGMHLLDNIQLESFKLWTKHTFSHGGFGQPVFIDNIFLGVEYPSVENLINNGLVKTGYLAGEKITKEKITSHTSVLGAAKSKFGLEDAFYSYIDKIKVNGTRPYLLYNSWYDFRNRLMAEDKENVMNEANVLKRIETFNKYMTEGHGIKLDAFVIDDGWDKYKGIWEIDSVTLPHAFNPFLKPLKKTGTTLGIWASPFCGYSNRDVRVEYGRKNGYEVTGDFLCFAGPKYKAEFKKKMTGYVKDYDMGYLKWDGFLLACNEASHGHKTGLYSREDLIATYLDMMQEVRKIKPDIFINITIGSWLSPWWLSYADCVWMQGEDYAYAENVPSLNLRDKAITYRDGILYNNFQKQGLLFPFSSLMTHGIIKGRLNLLGGKDESITSFSNEVMMYFARGIMMWELYVTPDLLSNDEWNSIASSVKWAKENKDILSKTKMILGDPLRREVYGYFHMTEDKGIMLLRNPDITVQNAKIKMTPALVEMTPEAEYYVKVIYPYNYILPQKVKQNGEINLQLNSYEVVAAEIIPASKIDDSLPVDVRYEKSGKELKLFGQKGSEKVVYYTSGKKVGNVSFSGSKNEIQFREISPVNKVDTTYTLTLSVSVPKEGFDQTRAGFLIEPDALQEDKAQNTEIELMVNGVKAQSQTEQEKGKWAWTTALLNKGENTIEMKLKADQNFKGKLRPWIFSNEILGTYSLKNKTNASKMTMPSKPYQAEVKKVSLQAGNYLIK